MAPLFKRRKATPPERCDLTVMVAETHGPVPLVLTEDVERVFAVLDRCLGAAIPEIERAGGRLQVEGGTTVVALWDGDDVGHAADGDDVGHAADGDDVGHAAVAVGAALAVHAAVAEAAEAARRQGESAQVMSLGLESGTANVGALAAGSWTGEAVIGPPIDRARRFAALARRYRCGIVAGPETARRVADRYLLCAIERVMLKGLDHPPELHRPLALNATASESERAFVDAYGEALNAFRRRDFARARPLWDDLAAGSGFSASCRALARTMAERAAAFAVDPPPGPWDGAWPAPGATDP